MFRLVTINKGYIQIYLQWKGEVCHLVDNLWNIKTQISLHAGQIYTCALCLLVVNVAKGFIITKSFLGGLKYPFKGPNMASF